MIVCVVIKFMYLMLFCIAFKCIEVVLEYFLKVIVWKQKSFSVWSHQAHEPAEVRLIILEMFWNVAHK